MVKIELKVSGMHCASCAMLLKDALEELDGVIKVTAIHETGIISVDFDDKIIHKDKIRAVIKKEGYSLEI